MCRGPTTKTCKIYKIVTNERKFCNHTLEFRDSKEDLFKPQGELHSDTCVKSRKGMCANPRKRLTYTCQYNDAFSSSSRILVSFTAQDQLSFLFD